MVCPVASQMRLVSVDAAYGFDEVALVFGKSPAGRVIDSAVMVANSVS